MEQKTNTGHIWCKKVPKQRKLLKYVTQVTSFVNIFGPFSLANFTKSDMAESSGES